MYIYKHVYTLIYIYTYRHIYIYIYIYTYIQIYRYTDIHIYRYTYIHIYRYTDIQIYKYTDIHLYTLKYTYIHIYICTCIHRISLYMMNISLSHKFSIMIIRYHDEYPTFCFLGKNRSFKPSMRRPHQATHPSIARTAQQLQMIPNVHGLGGPMVKNKQKRNGGTLGRYSEVVIHGFWNVEYMTP